MLKDEGVNVDNDLVAVQRLQGSKFDVTFRSEELKRRFQAKLQQLDDVETTSYEDSPTIVTVLFAPVEVGDDTIRLILSSYGRVVDSRRLYYSTHSKILDGKRQFKIFLEKDIPSAIRVGGRMVFGFHVLSVLKSSLCIRNLRHMPSQCMAGGPLQGYHARGRHVRLRATPLGSG
ncbi:hypothetical protein HOLleu_01467 [Holothuria leucospilota]|uniref:Uncharacterized protein n=1 Tax=Holothuria leucospilota TaxID=206669 RepID=A0A9Q1CPE2_HOLLE|nr:hypothetical protein HOLleu_01467 [Holothuria leucospilota]